MTTGKSCLWKRSWRVLNEPRGLEKDLSVAVCWAWVIKRVSQVLKYSFVLDALGYLMRNLPACPDSYFTVSFLPFLFWGWNWFLNCIHVWKSLKFALHVFVWPLQCHFQFFTFHCHSGEVSDNGTYLRACGVNTVQAKVARMLQNIGRTVCCYNESILQSIWR